MEGYIPRSNLHANDSTARTGSRILGRFELLEPVHVGRVAQVWRGRDVRTGHRVAVKIAEGPEHAPRVLHEATVLEALDHPDIPRPVAFGDTREGAALVLPWFDGPTLADALRGRAVSPAQAGRWAGHLCTLLAHCHARGVVHRDVKASNILLQTADDGAERFILLDFGIALLHGCGETPCRQAGLLGSVHTVSPEQVRGDLPDARADLYAVGVLMYRMVAGRYPFHARNPAEVIAAHTVRQPAPLGPELQVPHALEAAVMACLGKSPEDRPASAQELLAMLRHAEAQTAPSAPARALREPITLPPAVWGVASRLKRALVVPRGMVVSVTVTLVLAAILTACWL